MDCWYSCSAASEMLMTNLDLRRKWNGAVEWLHDELERVSSHLFVHISVHSLYTVVCICLFVCLLICMFVCLWLFLRFYGCGEIKCIITYEGRLINKLQNRVIPLVFQILKIQNIRFVGNLIPTSSCEFYDDDVTATSSVNIKYGDVATDIFSLRTACCYYIFAGKKINANQIHFDMHEVYGDKCFTNRTLHVWCKKMLDGQKFVSYTEVQSVVLW